MRSSARSPTEWPPSVSASSRWSTEPTATHLDGLITQFDLLEARQKLLEEERRAERVLTLRRVSAAATPVAVGPEEREEGPDVG